LVARRSGILRGVRILALVTDAYGGTGGIAQYNRDLLGALSTLPIVRHVRIMPRNCPTSARDLPEGLVQEEARRGRLRYSFAALRRARADRPDVIFCGHLYMAPLARILARAVRARLVIQLHGIEAWGPPSRLQREALEAADLVFSVSRFTRRMVLRHARLLPERVVVLPDTVADDFTPGDDGGLRGRLGLTGRTVLLTVGRMNADERYKGHDEVLRALPELQSRIPGIVWLVVGDGDDRPRLEHLARSMGLADTVQFLGAVDLETLKCAYRMADLFVMPSTGEGFGIVYLEAMASGTPALGLDATGARDPLGDGELGSLVRPEKLASAIVEALARPVDPVKMAAEVHRRFGPAAFGDTLDLQLQHLKFSPR
jgi:phosphatidylinositol alpha-1,6-mannosyltransferase